MNYQFSSKIAVETTLKRSFLQTMCLVGAVVLIAMNLILLAIDGFGELDIVTGIALPIILLTNGLRKKTKVDYVPTNIRIELEDGKAIIAYPALRRFVNGPLQYEKYEYTSEYTQIFQYSEELKAVRLYGFPTVTIGEKQDDTHKDDHEVVVYLPADHAEEICKQFEKHLHKKVERMDD